MEQIAYVWGVIKLRCSSCRTLDQMDVWPLVPMVYVGLLASMLIAWISLALQHSRRTAVLFWLLLVTLGPFLVFFLIGIAVLFLVVLVFKLLYFVFLGWRRSCLNCKARSMSIYGLGIADF